MRLVVQLDQRTNCVGVGVGARIQRLDGSSQAFMGVPHARIKSTGKS